MNSKSKYDKVSLKISRVVTNHYSTSFSIGTYLLNKSVRPCIYAIYGFVRLADEIVDSFNDYPRETLMENFIRDYENSLVDQISLNPILNAFQEVVLKYELQDLTENFLASMKMDLYKSTYSKDEYEDYIMGSARVVGLMCLKVFVDNDKERYEALKPYAMRLGSAFQKVNFLRDIKADYEDLGRVYFPEVSFEHFSNADKNLLITDIENDFKEALIGIKKLPSNSKLGVYVAYKYYLVLIHKLKVKSSSEIIEQRTRVSNVNKFWLLCKSYVRYKFSAL